MNEIRIEKSLLRKIAEIFLFLWGIVGLGLSVLVAHEAFRFDFQSHVTETFLFGMIVYMLIWIGGLFFRLFYIICVDQDRAGTAEIIMPRMRRVLFAIVDGPGLYGASNFFETMPSRPSLQTALNISTPSPSVCSTY